MNKDQREWLSKLLSKFALMMLVMPVLIPVLKQKSVIITMPVSTTIIGFVGAISLFMFSLWILKDAKS